MKKFKLFKIVNKFFPIKFANFFLSISNFLNYFLNKNYHKPIREMKIKTLSKISCQHDLIIETGTYLGFSSAYLSKEFNNVISIELSKEFYEISKHALRKYKNVTLINNDSLSFLLSFFDEKKKINATFYLDAHYMGEGSAISDKSNPLLDELNLILENKHKLNNFSIFIDDARTYMSNKEKYEDIQYFKNIFESAIKNDLNFSVAVDMIIISNNKINI